MKDLTPNIGSEVKGIQLTKLSDQQKDELALWVAEGGLVIFRKQDFVHYGAQALKEYGTYFGKLHVHQWVSENLFSEDLEESRADSVI